MGLNAALRELRKAVLAHNARRPGITAEYLAGHRKADRLLDFLESVEASYGVRRKQWGRNDLRSTKMQAIEIWIFDKREEVLMGAVEINFGPLTNAS